ncbi:hypothetical protein Tco_1164876 [Tanacetum coccineum]
MTTLRELINSNGRLIPEDPQPGVPRVGIPRPPRASMQDFVISSALHTSGLTVSAVCPHSLQPVDVDD